MNENTRDIVRSICLAIFFCVLVAGLTIEGIAKTYLSSSTDKLEQRIITLEKQLSNGSAYIRLVPSVENLMVTTTSPVLPSIYLDN